MKKSFIIILILIIPISSQVKKKEEGKRLKKTNEIIFNNDENTQEYLDMLETAFYKVRESYVDSVNESEIIKSAIKGMMNPLDPYTKFLSGSSKDRLDMLRTGKYGGVGIQIGLRRDTLTVLNPFEDSPAYSEGIQAGDQIIMIDSVKTKGMSISDASKLIKGELGSKVKLTILRRSIRKKMNFELTKNEVSLSGCGTLSELELENPKMATINDINVLGLFGDTLFFNTYSSFLKQNNFDNGLASDSDILDPCAMPENTIYLNQEGHILFNSTLEIGSISFDITNSRIINSSGGLADELDLDPFINKQKDFSIERSNIIIKHVPYWGIDESGIGYIRILKFSRNASKDFSKALQELQKGGMKGLVIDLRGNSGGLLNTVVSTRQRIGILDYLTDRQVNLLSTKGRLKRQNKNFRSRIATRLEDLPLAILINKSSASASEILAGVVQDLDKGVIIGEKSFGKGLVQSMYNLNDTTTLKVTTAKYYTPSGRLIQKQDYLNNGFLTDGLDKKDTLFTTVGGRKVKGGGGITPDIEIKRTVLPSYVQGLWKSGVFLAFAAEYVPLNNIQYPVIITDKIYKDFERFIKDYDIIYSLPGEKSLKQIKKSLHIGHGLDSVNTSFLSKLNIFNSKKSTVDILTRKLDNYYLEKRDGQFWEPENIKWIKNGLLREMSLVAGNEREKIRVSLFEDNVYQEAVKVLLDYNMYRDIFEP